MPLVRSHAEEPRRLAGGDALLGGCQHLLHAVQKSLRTFKPKHNRTELRLPVLASRGHRDNFGRRPYTFRELDAAPALLERQSMAEHDDIERGTGSQRSEFFEAVHQHSVVSALENRPSGLPKDAIPAEAQNAGARHPLGVHGGKTDAAGDTSVGTVR